MKRGPFAAALLAMPLALLVLSAAVAPMGLLVLQSVMETEVEPALPRTLRALRLWDGAGLPDDMAFEALAADLAALRGAGAPGEVAMARAAARLSADLPAMGEILASTAARTADTRTTRAVSVLVADPAWSDNESWAALRRAGDGASGFHLLGALGLRRAQAGGFENDAQGPLARAVLARGIGAAALATLASLILAWPLARWIAEAPPGLAALLSAATALPLLAGEAARAAGWSALLDTGPGAALIALVLGTLPLMVLPVAIALRRHGPGLPRAAAALGARPWVVFRRVHLPLARRGIAAGCALVFAQALGALAVPATLLPQDPLAAGALSAAAQTGNWGTAGALAVFLLVPALLVSGLLLRPRRGAP